MTGFQSKRQASRDLLEQALDALMCCSPDSEVGAALQIKTVADLRAHLAEPNEWRDAIDDELVCLHLGTVDSFHSANEALDALINWHIATALDPAVSAAAQALIDRGAAQRKPLTHEQRLDLLTAFEKHKKDWNAGSVLIDMIEAAHNIGDKT